MRRFIPFVFLAILFLAGASQAQAQADVTGTWEITYEAQRGARTMDVTFQQDGSALTGVAVMQMRGRPGGGGGGGGAGTTREVEISNGIVEGDQISFTITMGMGQRSMGLTFTGTVSGNTMEGVMSGMQGEVPFAGEKK